MGIKSDYWIIDIVDSVLTSRFNKNFCWMFGKRSPNNILKMNVFLRNIFHRLLIPLDMKYSICNTHKI